MLISILYWLCHRVQPSLSLSNLSSDSEAEGEELAQPEFRGLWEEGVHKVSFFLCAFCIVFLKTKTPVTPTTRKNTRKQSSFQLSDKNNRRLLRCSSQRSVIGTESLSQHVDQSNARLKPSMLFSLAFSLALGNLLVYTLILVGIMCYFPLF